MQNARRFNANHAPFSIETEGVCFIFLQNKTLFYVFIAIFLDISFEFVNFAHILLTFD